MSRRRPERAAAVLLLTAVVASLTLLAHPSGSASAAADGDHVTLTASYRFLCATDPTAVSSSPAPSSAAPTSTAPTSTASTSPAPTSTAPTSSSTPSSSDPAIPTATTSAADTTSASETITATAPATDSVTDTASATDTAAAADAATATATDTGTATDTATATDTSTSTDTPTASPSPSSSYLNTDFVELTLNRIDYAATLDGSVTLQVGLTAADTDPTDLSQPNTGPSLVTLNQGDSIKVHIAAPAHTGDTLYVKLYDPANTTDDDQEPNLYPKVLGGCVDRQPTNYGLTLPQVVVTTPQVSSCASGADTSVNVDVHNTNNTDENKHLQALGIDQLDYSVVLVDPSGTVTGTSDTGDTVPQLLSFDSKTTKALTIQQHATTQPQVFQVRVIGIDGNVVTKPVVVRCLAAGNGGPPATSRPTAPVGTHTSTPTAPPTSQRPTSPVGTSTTTRISTSAPASAPASTRANVPTSSAAPSSSSVASASSVPAPSGRGTFVASTSGTDSAVIAAGAQDGRAASSSARAASSASATSSSSASATATGPSPAGSSKPTGVSLVEAGTGHGLGLFTLQKDMALIVLAFVAAISGLIGTSVFNARRR